MLIGLNQASFLSQSGLTYIYEYTALGTEPDGINQIQIQATDTSYNTATDNTQSITFDFTAPELVITSHNNDDILYENLITVICESDEEVQSARINGIDASIDGNVFSAEVELSLGNNLINARARDLAGNIGQVQITVKYQEFQQFEFINTGASLNQDGPFTDSLTADAGTRIYFNSDVIDNAGLNIVLYEWDFEGDGLVDYSSYRNAFTSFIYTSSGAYNPTLKVINEHNIEGIYVLGNLTINRTASNPTITSFTATPAIAQAGTKITLSAEVLNPDQIDKYYWDFNGDGRFDRSSKSSVVVKKYSNPDTCTPKVRVVNSQGLADIATIEGSLITILGENTQAILNSKDNISEGTVPLTIEFDPSQSTGDIIKYEYDFDSDGVIDLVEPEYDPASPPTYTYTTIGRYNAKMYVTYKDHTKKRAIKQIKALYNSTLIYTKVDITYTKNNNTVTFDYTTQDPITFTHAAWDFDFDGLVDYKNGAGSVTHTYEKPGIYRVRVRLRNEAGIAARGYTDIEISQTDIDNQIIEEPSVIDNLNTQIQNIITEEDSTQVIIPQDALEQDQDLTIQLVTEEGVPQPISNATDIQVYREIHLTSQTQFSRNILISIPYADEDNDGIVDGTNIQEETLEIYTFNETTQTWELLDDSVVFCNENIVQAKTHHFSLFGIGGVLGSIAAVSGSGSGSSGGVSGCFIATASFGSLMEPQVQTLCNFRDQHLLTNKPGQAFVRFYYKYSPTIADYIREKESIKAVIRTLLKPLIWIAKRIN